MGCDSECTDAGYAPGTEIVFSHALAHSRTFQVEVTADERSESCEVAQGTTTCASLIEPLWSASQPSVTPGGARLAAGGFGGVHVYGRAWDRVTIRIQQDEQLIAQRAYDDSSYESLELNGEDCGETALSTQTLEVPEQ